MPYATFHSQDELDILAAIIEANRQRVKTNEQRAREAAALVDIEKQRAKRRQATSTGGAEPQHVETLPQAEGRTRDVVGEKVGMSGRTVDKAVEVVKVIDDLAHNGQQDEADKLRATLNVSVTKAHEQAQNTDASEEYLTLDAWHAKRDCLSSFAGLETVSSERTITVYHDRQ